MDRFDHELLDVYRASVEFLALADDVANELPRGRAYLADQLRRSASSVTLNVAEGAGEFTPREKSRFYRMARRSATEAAAILDVSQLLQLTTSDTRDRARALLLRIVAMLTRLLKPRKR